MSKMQLVGIRLCLKHEERDGTEHIIIPEAAVYEDDTVRFVSINDPKLLEAGNISPDPHVDRGAYPDQSTYRKEGTLVYVGGSSTPLEGTQYIKLCGLIQVTSCDEATLYSVAVGNVMGNMRLENLEYLNKWLRGANFTLRREGPAMAVMFKPE